MGDNLYLKDLNVIEEEITHQDVLAMTVRLTQNKYTEGEHAISKGTFIIDDQGMQIGHCARCGKIIFTADHWDEDSDHCKGCVVNVSSTKPDELDPEECYEQPKPNKRDEMMCNKLNGGRDSDCLIPCFTQK